MKRILILMLALVMCVGVLAACTANTGNPSETTGNQETNANGTTGDTGATTPETDAGTTPEDDAATLADAAAYLNSLYKDGNEITERDFDVVGRVMIGGVAFNVTWTVDSDKITIKESSKQGFYTVDLPDAVEEEIAYVLTATITDADGKTEQKTFKRKLPVINNAGIVTEPVENTAYKFFMKQANVGKTLFALGEMSGEKYIKSTNDAKAAPDFFAEAAEGGYKFYTTINGTKTYINARTTTAEDGKVSKYLELSAEAGAVWSYDAEVNAWLTTIDGTVYCVGTYSSYDTFCISEKSYITAENSGVSQFPAGLMTKEVAESLTPDEGPAAPTEITSIADFNALAEKLAQDATTPEKYIVKGVITEIKNTQYGNLYIQDEAGNQLYIYGLYDADGANRFDKMNPQPKVGDTITVMGVASQYNGPQMKNGWVTEIIPGEGGEIETDPPKPAEDKTIPAFNEIASAQPDKGDATADKYSVTGTITEIKNTTYGNLYIQDAEGNQLYIYGIYNADGTVRFDAMNPQPKVGDTITVVGVACNYGGPQMKNGWITTLTEGEDPNRIPLWSENKDVVTHLSFDELRINGDAGKGVFTPGQAGGWDKFVKLDETATGLHYWGWVAYYGETGLFGYSIDGGEIVYDASFAHVGNDHDALQGQIAATGGDKVHRMLIAIDLTGLSGKHTVKTFYKSDADKAVELTEFTVEMPAAATPDTPSEGAPVVGTAYKLYFIHTNKDNAVYYLNGKMAATYYLGATKTFDEGVDYFVENAEGGYYLYGMIDGAKKYINVVKSGTHTNAKYEDAANTVYTYDATLNTLVATIEDGSYILGTAADKTYDSLGPVKVDSNSIYAKFTTKAVEGGAETPDTPATPDASDKTIPAFNEIASAQPDKGDATAEKYIVTGVITEIKHTTYGNMYIQDAEGNQLYIYGLYSADGETRFDAMNPQPKVGDTITVLGVACNFNGPQMKNGWVQKLVAGEGAPETPDTPSTPAGDAAASISFEDVANRTVGNEEQQVWTLNGITVTNNKGGATSNVNIKYNDPIRCYKGSDLAIDYTGMKKLVIVCDNESYATVLAENTPSVGTLTVEGTLVTITFESAVNSVSFTALSAQVRISQVLVYTA